MMKKTTAIATTLGGFFGICAIAVIVCNTWTHPAGDIIVLSIVLAVVLLFSMILYVGIAGAKKLSQIGKIINREAKK